MGIFEMTSVVDLNLYQEKKRKPEWRQRHESAMKPTWIWHIAKDETEIKQKKQIDS